MKMHYETKIVLQFMNFCLLVGINLRLLITSLLLT